MPIYELECIKGHVTEVIVPMRLRDEMFSCRECGSPFTKRIPSVPTLGIWKADRTFPNLGHFSDMKFQSKAAYEGYLKEQGIAEIAHDGKVKRPHGNKVVARIGAEMKAQNPADGRGIARVADVGPMPMDPSCNWRYDFARDGPGGKISVIYATLDGVVYQSNLTYSGDNLVAISVWAISD